MPFNSFFQFVRQESDKLLEQTIVHAGLVFIGVTLAAITGISLGIIITRKEKWAKPVLGIAGILQTIPSIALLGFLIPLFGIGVLPAVAALFLYALLPIIRNTYTGIKNVDPPVTEAARAMGMTDGQVLLKVQLPLAIPVIMAGIRTATVVTVGVATLAAYIAAGGLGEFIFGGIALNNSDMILAGAIPAALLALLFDFLLGRLQQVKKINWILPASVIVLACLFAFSRKQDGKLLAGFTPEFMGRTDGDIGLRKVYGLRVPTVVINDNIMYNAIWHKKLDIISGSSTDGRVRAFDLQRLVDDKHIFPPYHAALIVRKETLTLYPGLDSVLNLLSGTINDSIMTELNYEVDYLKKSPDEVAAAFLLSKGMLQPPRKGNAGTVIIGSKIFGDGYILVSMYKMLLDGYTDLHTVTKTGLGGTIICFNALRNGQIDMYPEYTGTGLLVILKKDNAGTDPTKIYDYVHEAFWREYGIEWMKPIGFNNTYALMMRRSQMKELAISSISDLVTLINKQ